MKKGAMFGLDARIALAIFGALSVISGAALYSAIQQAKVTALITDMNEVTKAYDAYYLDTGLELALVDIDVFLDIHKLISSTEAGWKGPYLPYATEAAYALTYPSLSGQVYIAEALDGTWTTNTSAANWGTWGTATKCTGGTVGGTCFVWSVVRNVSEELYNAVDLQIDGSVDGQQGNVRFAQIATGARHIFIKHRAKS
jgi:type II secretory pathway pseudopilin PulG